MDTTQPSDPTSSGRADCAGPLHPAAVEGLEQFNNGLYWKAHEALETAWRAETGPVRELYQGVLQAGVVYLHITRKNYAGAIKVFHRSQKWLTMWPGICRGIDVGQLQRDLQVAVSAMEKLGPDRMAEFDLSLLKPVIYDLS
jgi:predicted metal-dependent hydrolase